MQIASSTIWTPVSKSISFDSNFYKTSISFIYVIYSF